MQQIKRSQREVLEAARQLYSALVTGDALIYFAPSQSWKSQDKDITGTLSVRSEQGRKWDWLIAHLGITETKTVSIKSEWGVKWANFLAVSGSDRFVTTNADTSLLTGIPVLVREAEGVSNPVGAFLKGLWNVGKPEDIHEAAKNFSEQVFSRLKEFLAGSENTFATRQVSKSELVYELKKHDVPFPDIVNTVAFTMTQLTLGKTIAELSDVLQSSLSLPIDRNRVTELVTDMVGRTADGEWIDHLALVRRPRLQMPEVTAQASQSSLIRLL